MTSSLVRALAALHIAGVSAKIDHILLDLLPGLAEEFNKFILVRIALNFNLYKQYNDIYLHTMGNIK
jgi:hypothetical protein